MTKFLLDNSLIIIFVLVMTIIARNELKAYMIKNNLDWSGFQSLVLQRLHQAGVEVLSYLVSALLITVTISLVSFKSVWITDVFHTVFFTIVLLKPIQGTLKTILK